MGAFSATHFIFLLRGTGWTLLLFVLALGLGGLGGFVLMLWRISPATALRVLTATLIQVVQGVPLLILLFLAYYGLSIFGFSLPAIVAATIGLSLYMSVYLAEIWRGSVESISRTQWQACEALGLSRWQALRHVIIPQAVRIALPSTVGFLVQALKSTSLASVVGFVELTRAGQMINNNIIQPFLIFSLVGTLYFLMCYPMSRWSRRLERKPT
ncbi:MAG TPA: amino acid ABC transporter permease [Burkholderiaceae bacterium]|jgi:polar amino acid transport system permease protein